MQQTKPSTAIAGSVLIFCSLAALLFMTHHPTLGDPGYKNLSAEIAAEAGVNSFVHGAMIVFVLGFYFGISQLAHSLGAANAAVNAGMIAFATATVMMVGAPLASGFIISGLAERLADDAEQLRAQIVFAGTVNQVLAKGGSAFYGAGIFLMSVALLKPTGLTNLIAMFGLVAGPVIAISVLSGRVALSVAGMTAVIALMGAWFVLVGVQMIRGKV
ncbi:MAG: hypothetical protein KJN99_02115 [Marinicaulis sp.]|nr:hypothetical protein [Marinicaulis sp.]